MMKETHCPVTQNPDALQRRLKEIPPEPGVYLMRDKSDRILYIGKSKKLRHRVRSYFRESQPHSPRIAMMVKQVYDIEFIVTDTEAEALALESNLIKKHHPYFNILLKDDKKYPYVCITWSENYPRIFITRKRCMTHAKDRYYGPYVDSRLLRNTLKIVQAVFPLRQRRKPLFKDRPCLNYDLGQCPGVCQALISPSDYHKIVAKVAMVFQGRTQELIALLTQQMETYAENLKFEQAGQIRDQIQGLTALHADQKVSLADDTISRDAIALVYQDHHCALQLFQIRAGRLVGRLGFFVDLRDFPPDVTDNLGMILQRVLEDHYTPVTPLEIPSEILVQDPLPYADSFLQWLQEKKGRKVTITQPQRQQKAQLLEMVKKNAQYELDRTQKFLDQNLQALTDLQTILNLSHLPQRLEGYDISHIQGSNAVGSQVVFIDGVPAKQHYRHYKIKNSTVTIGHSDDFASLAEVLKRRFRQYISLSSDQLQQAPDFPDLLMIDGGKGQLSAVVNVLEDLNLLPHLTVVSLAKKREEIFLPYQSSPLMTEPEQPGVKLLRRLRDEAHRFAVSFHRQQRLQTSRISYLDEIPKLGFERQKKLLAHFHSIDYIREASIEQLTQVSGIGKTLAEEIHHYFH